MKTRPTNRNLSSTAAALDGADVFLMPACDRDDIAMIDSHPGWRLWAELLVHALVAVAIQTLCHTLY